MKTVAIYARFSSDLQREASIDDQLRVCRQRAEREGWRVSACFSDSAMSGASMLRPGIQALLQEAQAGKFDIVLAEAIDRLSRDQEGIAHIFKRLRFAGVQLLTLSEGEISELHVGLKGTMGALFLKDLADKTRRGLRGRVAAGKSGGGNSYGYDVVRRLDSEGQPVRGERKINASQADTIRRIFNDYAAGLSPLAIAKKLNAEGIPCPSGKAWGPSTIHGNPDRGTGLLNNELYVGRLIWNRLRFIKDPETGKRVSRPNPQAEWVIQPVPDLRIVEDEVWQATKSRQTQNRASRNGKKASGYWDRRRPRFLLSGLMRCGSCGGGYINLNAERVGCAAARFKGTCNNRRTMRREELDSTVLEGLQHHLMDPALCDLFCQEYAREMNRLNGEKHALQDEQRRALKKVESELDRLVQALMDGVPASRVKAKMAELELRKSDLESRLDASPASPVLLHPKMAEYYRDEISRLREALNDPSGNDALSLMRQLIGHVTLTPVSDENGRKRLSVDLHGHLAGILALAGKRRGPAEQNGPEIASMSYRGHR